MHIHPGYGAVGVYEGNIEIGTDAYSGDTPVIARAHAAPHLTLWGDGTIPNSSSGSFERGDRIYHTNPSTHAGIICTESGTPGTWKIFGAIYSQGTLSTALVAAAGASATYEISVPGAKQWGFVQVAFDKPSATSSFRGKSKSKAPSR